MSTGPDPLARAARAMRYWETRQSALSHNLANASTTGFKGERVFAQLLDGVGRVDESSTDMSGGAVSDTGRTFDLAIQGDGFFVVETPEGVRLTRNGSFRRQDGFLVDAAGNQVRGDGGPVAIPEGEVTISSTGTILVDEVEVGSIDLARPRDGQAMARAEGALFDPGAAGVESLTREEVRIRQGALEESNVNPVDAMVEMLDIQRRYASVERTIRVLDEINTTAAERLGRLR